jgi:hypothetical protein
VSISPWNLDKKIESLLITLIRNTLPPKEAQAIEKKYATDIVAHYGGPKLMKIKITQARYTTPY